MYKKLIALLMLSASILFLQACGDDEQVPVGSFIQISPDTVNYTGAGVVFEPISVTVKNASGVSLGDAEVSMAVSPGMQLYHDANESGIVDNGEVPIDFSTAPTFTTDEFTGIVRFIVEINVVADYEGTVSAFSGEAYGVASFTEGI